jgi:hypothetical protein
MGTPDDVGRICTFLASDDGSYVNGTTILGPRRGT